MSIKLLSVAVAAATLVAAPAAAVTMNGTAAVSFVGLASNTPSIDVGTVITPTFLTIVGSGTGDLSTSTGSLLTPSAFSATNGSAFSFTSAIGNYTGTVSNVLSVGAVANRTLTAFALGTFTPAGPYASFGAGPASLTFAFAQNGSGGAVSGSFVLSTPPVPVPGVPEPAAWAMLISGFGLTGAAMRRRRAAVAA